MKWSKSWRHFCGNHRRIYILCFGLLIVLLAGCRASSTDAPDNDPTAPSTDTTTSADEQIQPSTGCATTNDFDGLANIYDHPISFNHLGNLPQGSAITVVGQMTREDGELFYQISLENAELEEGVTADYGWVYAEIPTIPESCSNIPEIAP